MSRADFRLSLVVPAYNEEESIDAFISAIDTELAPLKDQLEIVFVNDGSRDRTREVVEQAIARDPRVTLVNLARNFGKEAAMTAGLHQARATPSSPWTWTCRIPLSFWSSSSCGRPATMTPSTASGWIAAPTPDETPHRRWLLPLLQRPSTSTKLPENAGDFRLIDRKVVEAIKQLPERNRFMKGLFAWAGFRAVGVPLRAPGPPCRRNQVQLLEAVELRP